MKTLKLSVLLLAIISSTNSFSRSPHESESLINNEIMHGKVIAGEAGHLESEVARLTTKLERTLALIPLDIDKNEGRIISIIADQVERDLRKIKKDIDSLSYQKSSESIYRKLEQIEKDIEMI